MKNFLKKTYEMYADGFRNMTVGRSLWAIIIIKFIVLFAILKVLFFPDILSTRYSSDAERAEAVRHNLTIEP
ncbi:MAG: DUF4492 domain-containing protein [Muribaculaceae bacterium]|nr:DUF4492 domain-containing protein [Muribaculaceae bacterium]